MHEMSFVAKALERMMALKKDGKEDFTVRIPSSHSVEEFETLLRGMLNQYQIQVKLKIEEVPVKIKCECGYNGEVKIPSSTVPLNPICPKCGSNDSKIVSGREVEVI